MPEAALSGTIPHRPPNATATAEMPVRQDIGSEMIQREPSEIEKKRSAASSLRQITALHLNIYKWEKKKTCKKWETLMQLLMEVHLLCFLCGHAAVIL